MTHSIHSRPSTFHRTPDSRSLQKWQDCSSICYRKWKVWCCPVFAQHSGAAMSGGVMRKILFYSTQRAAAAAAARCLVPGVPWWWVQTWRGCGTGMRGELAHATHSPLGHADGGSHAVTATFGIPSRRTVYLLSPSLASANTQHGAASSSSSLRRLHLLLLLLLLLSPSTTGPLALPSWTMTS